MTKAKQTKLLVELTGLAQRQVDLFTPKKMYIEVMELSRDCLGEELDEFSMRNARPDPTVPMILNPICDRSGALELGKLADNRYWFWTLILTALRRNAMLPLTAQDIQGAAVGLTVGWSVHYHTARVVYEAGNSKAAMFALKRLLRGHGLLLAISQGYVLIHDELMADGDGPHYRLNRIFDAWFSAR